MANARLTSFLRSVVVVSLHTVFVLCLALLFAPVPALAQAKPAAPLNDKDVNARVDALLKQMTLREKIGQLTQLGAGDNSPELGKPEDHIRAGEAGSVLWTADPLFINKLQKIAVEQSRLKIPLLFGLDVIHGYHNTFPNPLGMAASWDPAMVEKAQSMAASEAAAVGINWSFGPMVDIARDARWGRMIEGAGEDPFLGAAMARAQVLGFQGPKLGTPNHVLASVKHFAGYGAAEGGRDYDASYIPEMEFRNVYLPPFQAAVDAGVGTVMSAYMDLNDVPASGNRWLLRDVLRQDMGFKGFVISDAFAVYSLVAHGYARDYQDAAFRGLNAGVDMDMASQTYLKNLEKLVQSGKIPMALIDESVRNVLAVKVRMGLFEHPYGDLANMKTILNDPEHRKATREAAQRSLVLLRNVNDTLPLKKDIKSIAVVGPLADAAKDTLGSWTVDGCAPAVTVLEGIKAKLPNAKIEYAKGGDMQRKYQQLFEILEKKPEEPRFVKADIRRMQDEAIAAVQKADLAVVVLGEKPYMSGEAASRATLALPGNQQQLLEAVVATGKPVVLVVIAGRPLDITWASEHVPAILNAWYPGTEGGNAVADVLFGDVNPGGKLPVSWPRSVGQLPIFYSKNLTQLPETAPEYRSFYWDESTAPLYPFGYGLSYTNFEFSNLKTSKPSIKKSDSVRVSVDVTNKGGRAGDEVVQLYIHQRAGSASRPVRQLKGFQRVSLAPGQNKTVTFTLGKDELKFWSPATKSWVVEVEKFDVWAGENSKATLHTEFEVIN
jgi:beta-glucosidase